MFRFTVSFSPDKLKTIKQSRVRVLGETDDGKLLILVNTQKNTNIELCSKDGSSTTAISFPRYIDLVSAALSPDNELLHIVERVPSPKGFDFIAKIIHIFGQQESKEVVASDPISAIFLPMTQPQNQQKKQIPLPLPNKTSQQDVIQTYQMLHFIGQKLTHLKITLTKASVDFKIVRGGVNLPTIIAYHFFRDTETLACVYQDDRLMKYANFKFFDETIKSKPPISIEVLPKSFLPAELALNPSAQVHLPCFRTQRRRFFFGKSNSQYIIIQQLYGENDSSLSFHISTYPRPFAQIVSIPGVTPDHPICCFRLFSLFILFVPNMFCVTIDMMTTPPTITHMPTVFALSECGPIASNLQFDNTIIDLVTGDIFGVEVDFSKFSIYKPNIDNLLISTISTICARQQEHNVLTGFLKYLENTGDGIALLIFIRSFIQDFVVAKGRDSSNSLAKPGMMAMRKVNSLSSMRLQPCFDRKFEKTPYRHSTHHHAPPAVKDVVTEIENEFPSAGNVERSTTFKKIFLQYSSENTNEEAAEKALNIIKRQNEGSLILRRTLDSFSKESSKLFSYLTELAVATETKFESLPKVQCLDNELSEDTHNICPKSIISQLSSNRVINSIFPRKEAQHWRSRIPSYLFEKEKTTENSTSESESSFSTSSVSSSSRIFISRTPKRSSYTHFFKQDSPDNSPPDVQL